MKFKTLSENWGEGESAPHSTAKLFLKVKYGPVLSLFFYGFPYWYRFWYLKDCKGCYQINGRWGSLNTFGYGVLDRCSGMGVSLSRNLNFFEEKAAHLSKVVSIHNKPPKKISEFSCIFSGSATLFCVCLKSQ